MERIESNKIIGANAYFTNFDHRIVKETKDDSALQKSVERTLKILFLTKNNIVCAASHLTSEFTYNIIKENPILLDEKMLLPALRSDKVGFSDVFENRGIKETLKHEMIAFYGERVQKTVSWELLENSNWFREKFVSNLKIPNSVIRKNLQNLTQKQINKIVNTIENKDVLDRGTIDKLSVNFPKKTILVLQNYRELIYHMSGARVVNCESTLPQENYLDYSLADLKNRDIMLSELQVFWKVFIEMFYEMLNKPKIPIELLDTLSFDDIHKLRQPIQDSSFIENYNLLFKKTVEAINKKDPNDTLYSMEELLQIESKLKVHYKEVFEKELKNHFKHELKENAKGLLKNTLNVGFGFVPGIPTIIQGTIGFLNERKAMHFNLSQGFNNFKSISNYSNYISQKQQQIESSILSFELKDKTAMIDLIRLVKRTIDEKTSF
jgi:hypothetical protein